MVAPYPAVDAPASYTFAVIGVRTLVADFSAIPALVATPAAPGMHALIISWPSTSAGWFLEESSDLVNWVPSAHVIVASGGRQTVTIDTTTDTCRFFHLARP